MTSEPEIFEPVAPEPAVPLRPATPGPRRSAPWVGVVLGAALVLAVGGVAFAAGRLSAGSATQGALGAGGTGTRSGVGSLPGGQLPGGQGPGGFGGDDLGRERAFRGPAIQGTVTGATADSITLRTLNGQTITISLGGSTTYHRETAASAGDVKTGSTVAIRVDLQSLRNGGTTPAASDVTILP